MEFIRECIHNHGTFFMVMNYIELVAGLLCCVMVYLPFFKDQCQKILEFLLTVIYSGGVLGVIAGLTVRQDLIGIIVGAVAGIILFAMFVWAIEDGFLMAGVFITVLKLLLVICIGLEGQGTIGMFVIVCILAALAGLAAIRQEQAWKGGIWVILCSIWGILEISAGIVGIFFYDITYMLKFLYSKEESVNFFAYLLKADFCITGHQSIFIFLILGQMALQAPFLYRKVKHIVPEDQ